MKRCTNVLAALLCILTMVAATTCGATVNYATGFDDGTIGSFTNRTTIGFSTTTASTGSTNLPTSATRSLVVNASTAFADFTQTTGAWCEQINCQSQMAGVSHAPYGTGSRSNLGLSLCDDGTGNGYRFLFVANTGQSSNSVQINKWSSAGTVNTSLFLNTTSGTTGPALGLIPDLATITIKFQYDGANTLSYKMWIPSTMHEPTTWMGSIFDPAPYNTSSHNKSGLYTNVTRTSTTTNGASNTAGATTLTVVSTANFLATATIQIGNDAGADKEFRTITSVTDGSHLVVPALSNTHVSGETVANSPATYADNFYCGPPGTQFTPIASTPSLVSSATGSATIAWQPPTGGVAPFVYDVVRATDSAFTQNVTKVASLISGNSYTDATVVSGTQYYYRVQVRDSVMNGTGTTTDANLPLDCISAGVSVLTPGSNTAATSYTVYVTSTSGNVNTASGVFVVQPTQYLPAQSLVVTAKDGATTVAQLTFAPNGTSVPASQTFTFTPLTAGSHSIAFTHTYTGTPSIASDPSPITYASVGPAFYIKAVNADGSLNTAVHMSPANWSGDGGISSSSRWGTGNFISTIYPGAYFTTYFSSVAGGTATLVLDATNSPYPTPAPSAGSTIAYSIDGNFNTMVAFDATFNSLPIIENNSAYLPQGNHILTIWLNGLGSASRWSQGTEATNVFRPSGILVHGQSVPGVAPKSLFWWALVGDSILGEISLWNLNTNGIFTYTSTGQNVRENAGTYSYPLTRMAMAMGGDVGVVGVGSMGWISPGNTGEVPGYYPVTGGVLGNALWNQIDGAHSRLDSQGHLSGWGDVGQEPAVYHNELFVNDISTSQSQADLQASISQALVAIRGALKPNTPVILSPSPTGVPQPLLYPNAATYMTYVQTAYNQYIASSSDPYCYLDILNLPEFGQEHDIHYTPNFHPTPYGAALLAVLYGADIVSKQFNKSIGTGIGIGGKL